jgi:hypothetical protein
LPNNTRFQNAKIHYIEIKQMTNQRRPSASRAIRRAQALGMTITRIVYMPDGSFRLEFDNTGSSEQSAEFEIERARLERHRRNATKVADKGKKSGKPPSES